MKLTKYLARMATEELIQRLRTEPQRLTTRELIGTPQFHGMRTLSPRQIAKLLRASGGVNHRYVGCGCRWASLWTIRK